MICLSEGKNKFLQIYPPPPSLPPRPPFVKWGLWAKWVIKTAHYSGQPGWWSVIVSDSAQVAVTERGQRHVVVSLGAAAWKFNAACLYSILLHWLMMVNDGSLLDAKQDKDSDFSLERRTCFSFSLFVTYLHPKLQCQFVRLKISEQHTATPQLTASCCTSLQKRDHAPVKGFQQQQTSVWFYVVVLL